MITLAARALLGPLLYLQAGRLRRTVVELPTAAGPARGISGRGPVALRVLIVGDSSAAGVGASTHDEALAGSLSSELAARLESAIQWQLLAEVGARSQDVLDLLVQSTVDEADIGIVVVGVNDITKEVPLRHALTMRGEIATLLRSRYGVKHVVFPALPEMEQFPALPQPLAWYAGSLSRRNNAAQASWASRLSGVSHAPMDRVMDPALMAADGFHPGPGLYAAVAKELALHIAEKVLPHLNLENKHNDRGAQ